MAFAKSWLSKRPHRRVGSHHQKVNRAVTNLLSEPERIIRFLEFLEERRALHAPPRQLTENDTRISVAKIGFECAAYLRELPVGAPAIAPLNKIEIACTRFMQSTATSDAAAFYLALGALRAIVAEQGEALAAAYAPRDGSEYDRALA